MYYAVHNMQFWQKKVYSEVLTVESIQCSFDRGKYTVQFWHYPPGPPMHSWLAPLHLTSSCAEWIIFDAHMCVHQTHTCVCINSHSERLGWGNSSSMWWLWSSETTRFGPSCKISVGCAARVQLEICDCDMKAWWWWWWWPQIFATKNPLTRYR